MVWIKLTPLSHHRRDEDAGAGQIKSSKAGTKEVRGKKHARA